MYLILQHHLNLLATIEENGGEVNDEILNAMQLTEVEFQAQAISVANLVRKIDDEEELIAKEIERLTVLKKAAAKKSEAIKSRLDAAMKQFGVVKIDTPTLKLSYRKSEAVEIVDASKVPFDYVEEEVVKTISKKKIKEDIKAGVAVPGAVLIEKQNLQIK